jgi:hypothetical protein
MIPTTTMLTTLDKDREALLTGDEEYTVVGFAVDYKVVREILEAYKGLNRYWNCIEKARIAREILDRGRVWMGGAMVASADWLSSYGHYWNPPYELHAWVELGRGEIFDAALPGLIQKGTETYDHIGPALIGRKPVVLAGLPQKWMRYARVMEDEG